MHPSRQLNFRKSSYSGSGDNCVEFAEFQGGAVVRDSQHPTNGHLAFPALEWAAFVEAVLNDQI